MTQPEALRLIQHMDDSWQEDWDGKAIRAELRRLYAVVQAREEECETHSAAVYEATRLLAEAREQRDELLKALKVALDDLMYKHHARAIDVASAAIAKVEGKT